MDRLTRGAGTPPTGGEESAQAIERRYSALPLTRPHLSVGMPAKKAAERTSPLPLGRRHMPFDGDPSKDER